MFKTIREDIRSVFARDPAARNFFEVLTNYPGVHAVISHRLTHWLWRHHMKWLARFLSQITRWFTGIEIHPGAKIGQRFFIDHGMGVVIGETSEVGNDVTIYQGVTLGGTSWKKGKRHPTLEDGVVVGAGAKVLGPFTVGADARVGSNAVITKEVPAGATVVGVPGRIIKRRDDQPLEADERRARMAEKLGFDAYGVSDMPDPIAQSINSLLDHIHVVDQRIDTMCRTLNRLDSGFQSGQLPHLNDSDFEVVREANEACGKSSEELLKEAARDDERAASRPDSPGRG